MYTQLTKRKNVTGALSSPLDIYTSELHLPNVGRFYLMTRYDNERDQVVPDPRSPIRSSFARSLLYLLTSTNIIILDRYSQYIYIYISLSLSLSSSPQSRLSHFAFICQPSHHHFHHLSNICKLEPLSPIVATQTTNGQEIYFPSTRIGRIHLHP